MSRAEQAFIFIGVLVVFGTAIALKQFDEPKPSLGKPLVAAADPTDQMPLVGQGSRRHSEPESPLPPLPNDPAKVDSMLNPDKAGNLAASDILSATPTPSPYLAGQGDLTADSNPYVAAQNADPSSDGSTAATDVATANPYPDVSLSQDATSEDTSVVPTEASDQELLDRMMSTMTPDQRDDFRATWWTMDSEDRQEWLMYLRYPLGAVTREPDPGSGN